MSGSELRARLKDAARPTSACVPLDRLGEVLSPAESAHVETCPRCQTELRLREEFERSVPQLDEGGEVASIVADLYRRRTGARGSSASRSGWLRPSALRIAASLLLVAGAGYLLIDRAPTIQEPVATPTGAYRAIVIEAIAPAGDVPTAPARLSWRSVDAAVRYDVEILEVDGTVVWRSSAGTTDLVIPEDIRSQFVSHKPFVWQVTARDAAGAAMGSSSMQRFRVDGSTPPGGR